MDDVAVAFAIKNVDKIFKRTPSIKDIVRFKKRKPVQALADVTLSVAAGETVCILGRNGAGKTTLLKTAAGLVVPDSGSLQIWGRDPYKTIIGAEGSRDNPFAEVGLISGDERGFYWRLSGRENLVFFSSLWGITGKLAQSRMDELLELVGLYDNRRDKDPVRTYSSGMKQRLAIARALIPDPRLLLVDEPARSLDYAAALDLVRFIRDTLVADGERAAMVATHQLWVAREFAGRLFVLDNGKIVATGLPDEVIGNAGNGQYKIQTARHPDPEILDGLVGVEVTAADDGHTIVFEEPADATRIETVFASLAKLGIRKVSRNDDEVSEQFIAMIRGSRVEDSDD